MTKLQLIRIETARELTLYKEIWDAILASQQNDNPFLEYAWFYRWWKIVGVGEQVEVFAVKKDHDILGFFPFSIQRKWGVHIFSFAGEKAANYSGFIVKEQWLMQTISFVFDELFKKYRHILFSLQGLLESSRSSQAIERYFVEQPTHISIFRGVTPFLMLGHADSATFFDSRKKWHEVDRGEKKLGNLGVLSFKTAESSELWQMFKLFDRHWSNKIDMSGLTFGKKTEFLEQLMLMKDEAIQVEVDALIFENQWIAFTCGICCRGRYVTYTFGHERNFNLFGVGRLVKQKSMQQRNSKNYKRFDWNIGYEPYKFDWHTGLDFTRKVLASSESKRAKLLELCLSIKEHIKGRIKHNKRIIRWKRNVIGQWRYLLKQGNRKDWLQYGQQLFERFLSFKQVDVYELATSSIPRRPVGQLFDVMSIQEAMQVEQENLMPLFYKGYTVYKEYFSESIQYAFALHESYWFVDVLQIVEPLPKQTYFLTHEKQQNIEVITAFFQKIRPEQTLRVTVNFWQWRKQKRLQQLGYKRIARMRLIKCGRFERSHVENFLKNGGGIHFIN